MSKFTHHFLPINPPVAPGDLINVKSVLTTQFIETDGTVYPVRLFGKPNIVHAIAVTLPEGEKLNEHMTAVAKITNHMISALRLTYSSDTDVVRFGDKFLAWEYEGEDEEPTYMLEMDIGHNEKPVNFESITSVFSATSSPELAPLVALLAESQSTIPVHYQILSLIRALELLFSSEEERSGWLDRYEQEFSTIGISKRQFRNAINELRTRCAHGVSRGGAGPLVDQAYGQVPGLDNFVKLLRRVVGERMADQYIIDEATSNVGS